jgi:hypothetical protein
MQPIHRRARHRLRVRSARAWSVAGSVQVGVGTRDRRATLEVLDDRIGDDLGGKHYVVETVGVVDRVRMGTDSGFRSQQPVAEVRERDGSEVE